MEWIVIWLGAALVVGAVAAARNRSGFGWFVLACTFSPVLTGAVLALMPHGDGGQQAVTARTHRHCPACREVVRVDARVCKHCRSAIETITRAPG